MTNNFKYDTSYYLLVLGLPTNFDLADLKIAYKREAKKWHPDLNKNDVNAENKLKIINEAYEFLINENNLKQENQKSSSEENDNEYNKEEIFSKNKKGDGSIFLWILKSFSLTLLVPVGILIISTPIILFFPILKEDINEINYCYAFEKIIGRNFFKKNNLPIWIKNTSRSALNLYIEMSRGDSVRAIYQESELDLDSRAELELACLIGYYGEHFDKGKTSNEIVEEFKKGFNGIFEF